MIEICLVTTSDSPDGQPWPPPSDGNSLWVIVRRADGYTLWRAIQLAQVRTAATDFGNSRTGSTQLKGLSHDQR
jgi:hypothetical protein